MSNEELIKRLEELARKVELGRTYGDSSDAMDFPRELIDLLIEHHKTGVHATHIESCRTSGTIGEISSVLHTTASAFNPNAQPLPPYAFATSKL